MDHVATTNGDRVGQAEHRPPGSSVIVIAIATVGTDLGTKRLDLVQPPSYFCFSALQLEKKNGRCVRWTTTNPATTAALICSCLTVSLITLVSRLHVLKSAELTCNSSLQAQKFYITGDRATPLYQLLSCFCLCFVKALRPSSSPTSLMIKRPFGPNKS